MEEMNEVIINATNQSKRRLPIWMQRNDASKNKKCGNSDEISSTSENQKETRDVIGGIVSMSSQTDVVLEKEKVPETTENYSKENIKKTKRGSISEDFTDSFIRSKRNVEDDITGMTDDEAELAVEDLLSIAEEFLSADKVMQHEQSVPCKSDSFNSKFFTVARSPALEAKLNAAIRSCQSLPKCNQTGQSACFSSSRTKQIEDAGQDMLELFIGPLLKMAPLKESDPEITSVLTTNYESDGQ